MKTDAVAAAVRSALERLATSSANGTAEGEHFAAEYGVQEGYRAALRDAGHFDQAWSVPQVLLRLAEAGEHLRDHHDCDCDRHEEVRECIDLAREQAKRIAALEVPSE